MDGSAVECRPEGPAWSGLEELREALRAFLARHCPDENDLDDVIQETFVRAARYRAGQGEVRRLKPWTMRIALNVLSDWRRRGRRLHTLSLEAEELDRCAAAGEPEEEPLHALGRWRLDGECARELLASSLSELRDGDRVLLDAFYAPGGSAGGVALHCGIPRHLVKVRLFRARRRLVRALRRKVAIEEGWSVAAS